MKVFWLMLVTALMSTTAFAQCNKLQNHPKGIDFAKRQFVYRDFIKAKKYDQAMPQWRDLYTHCRAGNGNILKDGVTIFKDKLKKAVKAKDKKEIKVYIDTVALLMNQRIECYGNRKRKASGLKYAGYRYYLLSKHYMTAANHFDKEDEEELKYIYSLYEKAKDALVKSIEADGNKAEANAISYYGFLCTELFKSQFAEFNPSEKEYFTNEQLLAVYNQIMDITDENIANNPKEKLKVKFTEVKAKVEGYFADGVIAKRIFDCEYFVKKYNDQGLFDTYKDNLEGLKGLFVALKRANCDETEPLVGKVLGRIKEINADIKQANKDKIDLARDSERAGDMVTAVRLYEEGINDTSIDSDKRYKAAKRLAGLAQKDKNWNRALSFYNKSASINSSTGEPYIKLGLLYLSANRGCAGYERQKVANIAIDYFNKAAKYGDTADEGSSKASEYRAYLPTKEQVFQRGGKIGGGITAGCKLKKSTTLRTKD